MTDSILIMGGGVAGLTAAFRCAEAGAQAIVVEHDAIVGGRLAAAMTQKSSIGDSIDGVPIPKLSALAETRNIEVFTLADLQDMKGRPGNFDISIHERARFVTDACTRCNRCRPVCPVVQPNEHDAGLSYRKAIYTPLPEALPEAFAIDIEACLNTPPNYLPCNRCTEVCDDDAIHFDLPPYRLHNRQVGAVIVAVGLGSGNDDGPRAHGYGIHPDVVTTAEMERLLTAPGPTGGFAAKPSNEDYPDSILVILDELTELSAHTAGSQIGRLMAQDVSDISLLLTTQPGDPSYASLLQSLPKGLKVNFGLLQKLEAAEDDQITVSYADFESNRVPESQYDMVLLGSDSGPAKGLDELARIVGVDLTDSGYVARATPDSSCATSRAGIYVAGGAGGPAILRAVVEEAGAAASAALSHLDPRLLGAGLTPASTSESQPDSPGISEDELTARIERGLIALLGSSD